MNLTRHLTCNSLNLKAVRITTIKNLRFLTSKSEPHLDQATNPFSQQLKNVRQLAPSEYRFIYPEFLPDPNVEFRNHTREKIERRDMLDRRSHIDIPEFYVGSILAVTSSDPHAAGKTTRFLGICISRSGCGLRARFILRNVVDNQGLEIVYELYDPTIQKIDVIRLEKRLDDELFYLRDAYPEYSTFDMNMDPEILPEGTPVPVNKLVVKLKPRPWVARWERENLRGVSNAVELITNKMVKQMEARRTPWEKYDLVKEYRKTIPEDAKSNERGHLLNPPIWGKVTIFVLT